jgi:hypothetical protein
MDEFLLSTELPIPSFYRITNSFFLPNYQFLLSTELPTPSFYRTTCGRASTIYRLYSQTSTLLKEDLRIIQYPTHWKRGGGCNIKESDQLHISWESVGNITGVSLLLTKLHATTIDGHGMLCRSNNSQR